MIGAIEFQFRTGAVAANVPVVGVRHGRADPTVGDRIEAPVIRTTIRIALLSAAVAAPAYAGSPPLTGPEAERFLLEAEVVDIEQFESLGVTEPRRAVLRDGDRTARALWKTHDEFEPLKTVPPDEKVTRFRDSYRHEVAAYRVSERLGLGLVPATVERTIGTATGSLQMWVEDATIEYDRIQADRDPSDRDAWDRRRNSLWAYLQLIDDMDYRNLANLLVTGEFEIYKVDNSRAFRWKASLREPEALRQFSRAMIDRLRDIDEDEWRGELGPWLEDGRLDAFLARRAELLELVDRRIAEDGEEAVLFP